MPETTDIAAPPSPLGPVRLHTLPRILAATLVPLLLMVWGYRVVGFGIDAARARDLRTAWDDAIPFAAWTVLPYSWVYTTALYPAFVIRCWRLFQRTVWAYTAVIGGSLLVFALLPVTAAGLRAPESSLDPTQFLHWGVLLTYHVDPPTNCFPSLHLSTATLAMLTAWTARPRYGLLVVPAVLGVAIAILTMKQHFVADGAAGLLVGTAAWWLLVRPHKDDPHRDPQGYATWLGPLAFLVLHLGVYAAFYVAFRAGLRP